MLKVGEIIERGKIIKKLRELCSNKWNFELKEPNSKTLTCIAKNGNYISIYDYQNIDFNSIKKYEYTGYVTVGFSSLTDRRYIHFYDDGTVFIFM